MSAAEKEMLAINEALMLSAVRLHEKTEALELLNAQLSNEVSHRKIAEERQLLLTRELAHRSNNLLAVVQSIVLRTLTGTFTLTEERENLVRRLHALARNQRLLSLEGATGGHLSDIIRHELTAHADQIKASGPAVNLNSHMAQTFGLVVHELATNAIKHGALSLSSGEVVVKWWIVDEEPEARFHFKWQENRGPPVTPPTRKGFGRVLLESVVEQEFGVPPDVSYNASGLVYEFSARLPVVVAMETMM